MKLTHKPLYFFCEYMPINTRNLGHDIEEVEEGTILYILAQAAQSTSKYNKIY